MLTIKEITGRIDRIKEETLKKYLVLGKGELLEGWNLALETVRKELIELDNLLKD